MTEGIIDITPRLPKQAATTEQDTWYYPEEETN